LNDKNLSWAWYAGGWNDALAGHPDPLFQFHHQPFAFFQNYADGTDAKKAHLKDETDFLADLKGSALPSVSFIKPLGPDNEHPGYASLARGQQHVADLVTAVQQSMYWADTAIIVTYDEHGGAWDHVAPPTGDRWGPGSRVPAIIISPYAKKNFVDHTQYDTTSILKLIETRWSLQPLGTRDAAVNDLTNAFDFSQSPSTLPKSGGNVGFDVAILGMVALSAVATGIVLRRRALS
jgi:acid phosphatase